eukprot:9008680-Pyramimonas_sp.AAC.2
MVEFRRACVGLGSPSARKYDAVRPKRLVIRSGPSPMFGSGIVTAALHVCACLMIAIVLVGHRSRRRARWHPALGAGAACRQRSRKAPLWHMQNADGQYLMYCKNN